MKPFRHSDVYQNPYKANMWYVYILASKKNGTLYVWVTNNLYRRVGEHKQWVIDWFTKKYNVHLLVYYEKFYCMTDAIIREKQIKNWRRQRKISQINLVNSEWRDLSLDGV